MQAPSNMQEKDGASGPPPSRWSVLIERVGDWKGISATRIIYWIRRGGDPSISFKKPIRINISYSGLRNPLLRIRTYILVRKEEEKKFPSKYIYITRLRLSPFSSIFSSYFPK